jgi:hypothetical protein
VGIVKPGVVPSNRDEFADAFGDDFAALEKRLIVHLKDLPYRPPFAEFPHIVAAIALAQPSRNNRAANVFLSEAVARRWAQETLEKLDEEKRKGARITLSRHPNRAAAERFASQWLRGR